MNFTENRKPKTENETLMDTILVVDDEVNYLTVMEALLGELGL